MRKLTTLLIASSLALGTAGIAHANDAPKGQHEMRMAKEGQRAPRGMHHEMMLKGLNLTDAQKQQVKEIVKASHDNMRKVMQDERREMHNLVISDAFDTAKAQAQLEKADAAHKTMRLNSLETQNKIYNILTPEQKKQYNDNFEKRLTQSPKSDNKPAAAE
ncbi:ATP-independent periplasmic protein-refolding chaperone [Brenneria goodwinii]|uniref:ATP-independent periplasmic protein-refolding chaperone Spy n=1 Tax=Brenneria goodwinii TaxID=1109412 RepID=UPI000EF1D26D|nr:ATP-independent periplasmic protein-refolding chaperone Spy [Brenneria goodwinii]MCG8156521.1 ATP-independent periplasmic protein-refolding chaperone [Brenneria goodwinii]MCG8162108.1 ATP-independent periplasmic protein-refolding chaperone [Brenneria goodwinii]MCG8166850.1 ATP-independent periplasmic protein-refolding chaperone [Brenneria goodwinii]MCG8171500.1 ATP-independent periplasmic protein-refolding chaperone [Brenneria goodwinii]MCG8175078.1 ATP-independent periplasmic protein-refol